MACIGIVGSGFGLYGYLPALCRCDHSVILPARYKPAFQGRKELARYSSKVRWVQDEEAVLAVSEGIVLALPPTFQSKYLPFVVARNNLSSLFLEKPLASTPETAMYHLENLINADKKFRINYSFRYLDWASQVKAALIRACTDAILTIDWRFMSHHYQFNLNNWKRYKSEGGGVIRFYGIHLIALLSEFGYSRVAYSTTYGISPDQPSRWSAVLQGSGLPECQLQVDSCSDAQRFHVSIASRIGLDSGSLDVQIDDPFQRATPQTEDQDRRVQFIERLCRTLDTTSDEESYLHHVYIATNKFWHEIEGVTIARLPDQAVSPDQRTAQQPMGRTVCD